MKTMVTERVGRTLLMVDGLAGADEADWAAALTESGKRDYDRVVVLSLGPPLSSQRRNALRTAVGDHPALAAILTSSKLVETVVSILNLFFKNRTKAFAPDHLEAALDFLQMPPAERPLIAPALARMRTEVGAPERR